MQCPNCNEPKTYVTDSRSSKKMRGADRRARVCHECEYKFYTYEMLRGEVDAMAEVHKALKTLIYQAVKEE
jgi:transcriptional regulator NrdR family protein